MSKERLDLLVVGAGPTGIAIGVEARRAGLSTLLVDRGALCGSMVKFPADMTFFTTRDKLEIADIPFTIPEDKPNRRQALSYYQGVVRSHRLPLALYEDVLSIERREEDFEVTTRLVKSGETLQRRASAVVLAMGYFEQPQVLSVPGEELEWVRHRYGEPYGHYGQHVVVVGGGNSACETALDLWRHGVKVTMVVRGAELKPTVKYWVKPDVENRIEEGSIAAYFNSEVREFRIGEAVVETPSGVKTLAADAFYVLIGYLPDSDFQRRCGIRVDPQTLVPTFDKKTLESNVPGLYVAGTLQAGRDTGKIFIENSRDNGERIVAHLLESQALASTRQAV